MGQAKLRGDRQRRAAHARIKAGIEAQIRIEKFGVRLRRSNFALSHYRRAGKATALLGLAHNHELLIRDQ